MENVWSNGKVKVLEPRTSNEHVQPLQIDMDDKRGRYLQPNTTSPRFQPYAAENIDVGSPLARYIFVGSSLSGEVAGEAFTPPTFGASKYRTAKAQEHCGSGSSSFGSRGKLLPSPLSSIDNSEVASLMSPPMYQTQATGDDDVIVMDDILVRPVSGGKSGRSSSSSARGSLSSTSSTARSVKTEICRAREESGNCCYNSECQYRSKKEEYHSAQSKFGEHVVQTFVEAESITYSPCNHIVHQNSIAIEFDHPIAMSDPLSTTFENKYEEQVVEPFILPELIMHSPSSHILHSQFESAKSNHKVSTSQPPSPKAHNTLTNFNTSNDWSPLDDGIEVSLPDDLDKVPSKEEVDAYISSNFLGQITKKRLPIFVALYTED